MDTPAFFSFLFQTPITPGSETVQAVTLFLVFVVLITELLQVRLQPSRWLWGVPMIGLMLHMAAFYGFLFLNRYTSFPIHPVYTSWSSVLRLHELLTLSALGICRLYLVYWKSHGVRHDR